MARCGCASNVCTCTITGGAGVQVSGTGTPTDPYVLAAQPTVLKVADSTSVDLTLTGNGSSAAPYVLRADLATSPNPGGNVPSGTICDFGGDTAPTGWLICDGSAVARVEFSALFSVIGTKYGTGDGSTTYNLPDLRSRIAVGAGPGPGLTTRVVGAKGGAQDGAVITHGHGTHGHTASSGFDDRNHTHANTITDGAGAHTHPTNTNSRNIYTAGAATFAAYFDGAGGYANAAAGGHNHTINAANPNTGHAHGVTVVAGAVPNAGGSATDTNMPPYVVLNKMIKS